MGRFEVPQAHWSDDEIIARYGETAKKTPWPIYLGRMQRQGFKAPMKFFLVWCHPCRLTPNCGFTVTYEAGYEKRLQCSYCKRRYDHFLLSRRIKDLFVRPQRHPFFLAFIFLLGLIAYNALR